MLVIETPDELRVIVVIIFDLLRKHPIWVNTVT